MARPTVISNWEQEYTNGLGGLSNNTFFYNWNSGESGASASDILLSGLNNMNVSVKDPWSSFSTDIDSFKSAYTNPPEPSNEALSLNDTNDAFVEQSETDSIVSSSTSSSGFSGSGGAQESEVDERALDSGEASSTTSTLPGYSADGGAKLADVSEDALNLDAEVEEGIAEGTSVAEGIATGGLSTVAQLAGMAITGVTNAINENKLGISNATAQQTYNNAMSNGLGIGFQNVAANNLANTYAANSNFKGYASFMTSMLGPVGGLIAAFTPVDQPEQQQSFTALTASGGSTNAQSDDIVNSASA